MKKITLLFGLLLGSSLIYAQNVKLKPRDSTKVALLRAKFMLNPKSKNYDPQKAFIIYQQYADKGNAQAMNGLANMHNNGLGTVVNEKEALKWYEKAAKAGYANAWYNLGCMYKAGIGTVQNFEKAYQAFSQGADLNNASCFYGQGYMLYKGFGTTQNYEQSAALFKKGAKLHNIQSWFMLGLCYRNGYGIAKNNDSAQYYLAKAASYKDLRAINELESETPENSSLIPADAPQPPSGITKPIDLKTGFKKVKQNLPKNKTISGEYQGYSIRFDWSGKHIIAQNNLRLNLEQKNNQLTGQWEEDGQEPVYINAKITDTALVFSQTGQAQKDHYHRNKKLLVQFQNSKLHLVQSQDTIYLSGSLNVYVPKAKEPEKPRLIMLIRTGVAANTIPQLTDTTNLAAKIAEEERLDALALQFLAYPNPFSNSTNLKYTLRRASTVGILVTDIQTGQTVYRSQHGLQQAGDYTLPLNFNARPGTYVLTLQYNSKLKSIVVIKN